MPSWSRSPWKGRERLRRIEEKERREGVLGRITDLCEDADFRLDRKPGTTYRQILGPLGDRPSIIALQSVQVRLLRWVSLGCPAGMEEAEWEQSHLLSS